MAPHLVSGGERRSVWTRADHGMLAAMARLAVALSLSLSLFLFLSCFVLGSASASPQHRCGTPDLLASLPRPALAPRTSGIALTGHKITRDAFGGGFEELITHNFAVKWKDPSITQAQAQVVGDALEAAWTKYIGQLGHAPCTGCQQFRLNAYISRSIDNPPIDFGGGYAWIDDDGYPYFVISRDLLAPGAEATVRAVAVHEFYHDIQFSTGAYAWETTPYGWFWEATAEWASQEVLPGEADPFVFSGAFALKSELPLYHYGDPFGGDPVEGVHQYGASIFFRFVTDKLSAPDIVVNAWEQGQASSEPLAEVARHLPSDDLPSLHTEFAARNAIWDHLFRHHVLGSLALFKQFDPTLDEIAHRVPAAGVVSTQLARAPYGFGYSTIEIERPAAGRFGVEVTMTPSGPATLAATVVYGAPGSATYTPLVFEGTTGTATIDLPPGVERAYLVVSPTTDERLTGAPIPMTFEVTPLAPEPEPDDSGCCGAGSSSPAGSLALGLVAMIGLGRRRRDRAAQR
jgi:uncharacterized protein (TIGR03382 family)